MLVKLFLQFQQKNKPNVYISDKKKKVSCSFSIPNINYVVKNFLEPIIFTYQTFSLPTHFA